MTRYPPRGRRIEACQPQRDVLPIPASPDSTATPGKLLGRLEHAEDRCELFFPADKLRRCDWHVLILCAIGPALKPFAGISSRRVASHLRLLTVSEAFMSHE